MEGPARDRHRRHRRLPRPGRRQGRTPRHRRHPTGRKTFDKCLPNTEPKLRELFAKLQAKHEVVLVVVDQPASIGALPLAVARDMGCSGRISAGADDATDRRLLPPVRPRRTRGMRSSSRTRSARCLTLVSQLNLEYPGNQCTYLGASPQLPSKPPGHTPGSRGSSDAPSGARMHHNTWCSPRAGCEGGQPTHPARPTATLPTSRPRFWARPEPLPRRRPGGALPSGPPLPASAGLQVPCVPHQIAHTSATKQVSWELGRPTPCLSPVAWPWRRFSLRFGGQIPTASPLSIVLIIMLS